jgi:glyoxylase-like metal-dependent hydrolase (beta-lactamase superfamily II)
VPTYYDSVVTSDLSSSVRAVEVRKLRPGLWRWTAPHPGWTPAAGGPNGWDQVVSSYLWSGDEALVLFDPLAPPEGTDDAARFWEAIDRDVAAHGSPHVLLTVYWHARSSQALVDRYEGVRVWAHEPAVGEARTRTSVTDVFAAGDALPGGVEPLESVESGEILFSLPRSRALVSGDVLLGTPGGGIRICPDSWLGPNTTPRKLREELRTLLDRPVELVLPTHGEPVTEGARDALDDALG